MAPIDILFLFGFLGIWIPQAFWAWLSYQAWKYSKTAEKELQNLPRLKLMHLLQQLCLLLV